MKTYWLYRILFFGAVLLSVALVFQTISTRQTAPVRATTPRQRTAPVSRPRDVPVPQPLVQPGSGDVQSALASRVRVTTVVPYRREIELVNFGEAAEDLSQWKLSSPRPGGEDVYVFPAGTIILSGESLVVVVDEGVDAPGELHWRVAGERVLDLAGDSVTLVDESGAEVSRFTYARR